MVAANPSLVSEAGLRSAVRSGWRAAPVSTILPMAKQASLSLGRAEVWAAVFTITCPIVANCAGTVISKLASP